jgi:hypothetical protein
MAQVPAQSFYLGPFAVYTSPTGMTDPITGQPYLGGTLHEGDYCDLTASEAAQWNIRFGSNLFPGRYRFGRISPRATAANIAFGLPAGWGLAQSLAQVVLSAAGSGYTITATGASSGTVTITSSTSGGTAATALLTLSSGAISGVQLVFPGNGFTAVPTFSLSELTGGSGGSVLAQMANSPNLFSSFDSSCAQLSDVRGIWLTTGITSAQITANAWGVIQEQGVANVLVNTATNTAAGCAMAATTGAVVTTTTAATAIPVGFFGYTLDVAAASTIVRGVLRIPVQQG